MAVATLEYPTQVSSCVRRSHPITVARGARQPCVVERGPRRGRNLRKGRAARPLAALHQILVTPTLSVDAVQLRLIWSRSLLLRRQLRRRRRRLRVHLPRPIGVTMSDWICGCLRAWLYTRTSSIIPAKYCPKMLSPPICSGLVESCNVPRPGLARHQRAIHV